MTAPAPLSALAWRLAEPSLILTPDRLGQAWFVQSVEARLPVLGVLAGRAETVLPKVRGAWGRRLMEGASAEALAGRACPFDPPCALDVFFREQLRAGREAVPKPYVFEADRAGPDLIIRLKVFGFASSWTPTAAERLVEALNGHVDWRNLSGMQNLHDPRVADLRVATVQGLVSTPAPQAFTIRVVTPFEDENGVLADQPWTFIARAARRVWGLARWHDAEIEVNWREMSDAWKACDFHVTPYRSDAEPLLRKSRGKGYRQSAFLGEIRVENAAPMLWPILMLAQTCGAGRGAVEGLGRFEVTGEAAC